MAMMGPRQEARGALFYGFSLEDHVPGDLLLRPIDRFVDLADIRTYLAPYPCKPRPDYRRVSGSSQPSRSEDETEIRNSEGRRRLKKSMIGGEPLERHWSERQWRARSGNEIPCFREA